MTTATVRPEAAATLGPVSLQHPAEVVYSRGFESGTLDGWIGVAGSPEVIEWFGAPSPGGGHVLQSLAIGSGDFGAQRTLTGLTVGRAYTVEANVLRWDFFGLATNLRIGVTGRGYSANVNPAEDTWQRVSFTFTASSATHQLVVMATSPAANVPLTIDDVLVTRDAWIETGATVDLPISGGRVTLDESYAPYVMAQVEVPLSAEVLELIDPRGDQRVALTASANGHSEPIYSAWAEQRKNWHSNPRNGGTVAGGLALGNIAYTAASGAGTPSVDGSWQEITATALPTPGTSRYGFRRSMSAVAPANTPITIEITARGISTLPAGVRPRVYADFNDGGTFRGTLTAFLVDGENTIVGAFPAGPTTGVNFYVWLDTPAGTPFVGPAKIGVTNALVEVGPSGAPFDGSSISEEYARTRWLGAANNSASVLETRTVSASEWVPEDQRAFDLGLRARTVDHKTGKVTLELASDEALLFDKRRLAATVDSTARMHEASLRAVCSWALGKIGANLSAGNADTDVTARWRAENVILNPDVVNLTGYTAAGNATLALNTTANAGIEGSTGYVNVTSVAAGQSFISAPQAVSARKGQMWTFSCFQHRGNTTPALNGILRAYEVDAAGTIVRQIESTPKAIPAGGTVPYTWVRQSLTFTVEHPNTVKVIVYGSFMATAASQIVGMDGFMLTEGPVLLPYFSGAIAPAGYVTAWTGQAAPVPNNSVSVRSPADGIERLPELFDWKPGQSLNDFLRPLVEVSGLRLFCDELRVWRLVDPTTYEVPGYVVVQSKHNATEGTDTIDRNTDEWGTGVLVIYRWTDADGTRREAYDFAGTDDKVITIERESEYPGPGAAAHFLNSRQGRGRQQEVTALVDFRATPTQDVTINLPGTLTQTGKVRRVTLGLSDGLMDVGTRGLTDALPGSWAEWNPSQVWADVNPTLKWKDA